MENFKELLTFTEQLIHDNTSYHLSDLQRTILLVTFQKDRKNYDEIAEEYGYSVKYIKQRVAPELWQLLSEILDQKVTKSNVKTILQARMGDREAAIELPLPVSSPLSFSDAQKGTILLVDDRPQNLKLLSNLLEEQGYEVQQAISGTVALNAIALAKPDLILLDIDMPGLDGYTVCQRLKANPDTRDIPVIFISALDAAWDKVKAFSVGGSDYVTKPFQALEVLARVENQLKVQRLTQELKELKAKNARLEQAQQK
ncbi:MAG: response regulator [Spirulina sp.]